ncbi:MAG: OmpH family outer membrane protein [Gemmatimonadales bacterium]|nr:MAG: OmpH family outer membrane protein [Gemmatimonadales bacterium]
MRTHRISTVLVAGAALVAAACGSNVTVVVTTEGADGAMPQANLPVQFLPFDRDSVFDVLDAQASTPRPQMSADLQAEAEAVARLQAEWRSRDTEWANERDALQQLSTRLQNMDSRDPDYRRLFDQFNQREATVGRLDRDRTTLFEQFTRAQEAVTVSIDSFKIVREIWEDEAYAGYVDIELRLVGGGEALADTTHADGIATMTLRGDDWWVTTRAPVSGGEVYWNLPVGAQEAVTLNESNGEIRLRL